ncbi:small, acid-soluble spore protein K [Bacillus solimangrovi]|uniref:Small, acid-soluble spore protein K n=1 Tax=Bacillus solimangrovi TaxID=1305675 RepID=A0A1E5LBL3_9BACI|nr:small, acid-soluble spore protein K [Bacillus solimangrovi]OEH91389.1 small, acid-soluble spore protein K [Bacillus solimangrovi]
MRNKEQGFPAHQKMNGEPRAKAEYSSKRANGTINTNPQQRMRRSNQEFGEQD